MPDRDFWRSLGNTDVLSQLIVIGLIVLFVAFLVWISERLGGGSSPSPKKPDKMKGKRKIYDKDGNVVGYIDQEQP